MTRSLPPAIRWLLPAALTAAALAGCSGRTPTAPSASAPVRAAAAYGAPAAGAPDTGNVIQGADTNIVTGADALPEAPAAAEAPEGHP
jgi:hypothetical protein